MQLSLMESVLAGLSALSVVLAGSLIAVVVRSKRRSEFSIFLVYCGSYTALLLLIWLAYFYAGNQYSRVLWTVSVIHMALEFGVMYEIFRNALKPYSGLVDLGNVLFTWASVLLLVVAVLTALATGGPSANKLGAAFGVVERSMRLMECGLLVLFFFFEKRLGISWHNPNVNIALGLGSTASVDLILSYLKVRFPTMVGLWDVINSGVFMAILACWCYCLARQTETALVSAPSRLILQRWNESLLNAHSANAGLAPGSVESFLPGIERTVDKVLSRKIVT